MNKLIKNAMVYRISLPARNLLEDHLAELPFRELAGGDISGAGFVPVRPQGSAGLVEPFPGGLAFAVRYDEKVMPGSTVLAAIAKRVAEIEDNEDRRVGRKERQEIKENVLVELCHRALSRTSVVTCFYHPENETLIVPVSSQKLAATITSSLIKAVGSAKTQTIHIDDMKGGLTTRLQAHIGGAYEPPIYPFGDFELGSDVWLARGKEKVTYQLADLDSEHYGLSEVFPAGFAVSAVRLSLGAASFKLTNDFKFKSVRFEEPEEPRDFDDAEELWGLEAGAQVAEFVGVVTGLCDLFGYKPPVPAPAEADILS